MAPFLRAGARCAVFVSCEHAVSVLCHTVHPAYWLLSHVCRHLIACCCPSLRSTALHLWPALHFLQEPRIQSAVWSAAPTPGSTQQPASSEAQQQSIQGPSATSMGRNEEIAHSVSLSTNACRLYTLVDTFPSLYVCAYSLAQAVPR